MTNGLMYRFLRFKCGRVDVRTCMQVSVLHESRPMCKRAKWNGMRNGIVECGWNVKTGRECGED